MERQRRGRYQETGIDNQEGHDHDGETRKSERPRGGRHNQEGDNKDGETRKRERPRDMKRQGRRSMKAAKTRGRHPDGRLILTGRRWTRLQQHPQHTFLTHTHKGERRGTHHCGTAGALAQGQRQGSLRLLSARLSQRAEGTGSLRVEAHCRATTLHARLRISAQRVHASMHLTAFH